jgi:hypothetical protein
MTMMMIHCSSHWKSKHHIEVKWINQKIIKINLPNHQRGESDEKKTQNSKDHGNNTSYKDVDRERLFVAEVQIWK